jgi:hypothetical protein
MTNKTKGWKDILDNHFDKRSRDFIHTSFPAVITRIVNRAVVDVQPLVSTKRPDGTVVPYPELFDVRMQTYAAQAGDVFISLPFKVGDNVWVFVSERDTSELMQNNRVVASTTITHDLSDCFCIPMFFTNDNIKDYSADDLVIGNKESTATFKPTEIAFETPSITTSGDVLVEGEVVTNTSVDAPKFITEGQTGIPAVIVVGSTKYTFTNGILTKQEPA